VSTVFGFDDFELDVGELQLRRAGVFIKADSLVLRLLEAFVRRPGQLLTKEELVSLVWGGRIVSENALTVAIARLRKLLDEKRGADAILLTVHRRGYRFLRTVVCRDFAAFVAVSNTASPCARPFVGREQEVGDLTDSLRELRDHGGMIVLAGEAGVGKTRIAELVATKATDAKISMTWGYCRELAETPALWLVSGLLRDLLGPRLAGLRKDARFQPLLPELSLLLPELDASAPASASRDDATPSFLRCKSRAFDAVTRALTLATEHEPHIFIVDDLHCADDASLELFEYLLPAIRRTHLLLLATSRSGVGRTFRPLTRILGHHNCLRVDLLPLSETQVARYLEIAMGDVDPALGREVFRLSEGNPLYMVELARQLRRVRDSASQGVFKLTIPNIAVELTRQRLAGLDDRAREVLTCAAVIGRKFSLPLLQAILGRSAVDLVQSLDDAVERAVVRTAADSRTDFVFVHEMLRAALYDALGPAERRGWHVRAAQALEQRPTLARELVADRAYHVRSALPEGDLARAVDCCIAAADAAARDHAMSETAHHLQHARAALELLPNASPRLWNELLFRQAIVMREHSAREGVPVAEQLSHLAHEGCDVPLASADGAACAATPGIALAACDAKYPGVCQGCGRRHPADGGGRI
jgi:DNA-binding winged helix-turn-helix (wHTH) protein